MPLITIPGALLASAGIGAGASLLSGFLGSNAAKDASATQAASAKAGLDFQKQVYNTGQEQIQPYLGLGAGAVSKIGALYGMGGGGSGGQPDYSGFTNSPDYNFAFQQGQSATQNTLSSSGNLRSGAGAAALTNFGQGLASQQYGNYFSRLMGMAGMGQAAAGASMNFGSTMGGQIANQYGNLGTANASGMVGSANAWSGALNGVAGAASGGLNNYMQYNLLSNMTNRNTPAGSSSYNAYPQNPFGQNPGQ